VSEETVGEMSKDYVVVMTDSIGDSQKEDLPIDDHLIDVMRTEIEGGLASETEAVEVEDMRTIVVEVQKIERDNLIEDPTVTVQNTTGNVEISPEKNATNISMISRTFLTKVCPEVHQKKRLLQTKSLKFLQLILTRNSRQTKRLR
jgi:hypothetical protein